ncbi:MAG: serine/threonine protein kinase [Myxococcales bacterium]|nr:serine/threonine protein kinase [Myxococcales bacterium]
MRICPECKNRTESRICEKDGSPTLLESALGAPKTDPLAGQVFDNRYLVMERLGKGGMGSVYKARQINVGREVALKVLNPDLTEDADAAGRFVREAKVASRLRHPNTIVIFDFGHSEQGLYIAMELLTGESLYQRLRRVKVLRYKEVAKIGAAMARSLDEAHSMGIVHRDLKPGNVFLSRVHGGGEVVKVLDFGVARFFAEHSTRSGESMFETNRPMIVGTLQYMAPEQIRGENVDARSDLYALGIMFYEALTGSRPFEADNPVAIMQKQLEETAPALPADIPEVFRNLVASLLQKRPDRRPSTAAEVATILESLCSPDSVPSTPAVVSLPSDLYTVPDSTQRDRPSSWEKFDTPPPPPPDPALTRAAPPLPPIRTPIAMRSDEGAAEEATAPTPRFDHRVGLDSTDKPARRGSWLVAALAAIGAALGVWWFVGRSREVATTGSGTVEIITAPAGATIIDAETKFELGVAPLTLEGGPRATKAITARLARHRSKTVDVPYPAPGAERKLDVELTKSPLIPFDSDPPGAEIILLSTGETIGTTPFEWSVPDHILDAKAGARFRYVLPGYQDRDESLGDYELAGGRGLAKVQLAPVAGPSAPTRPTRRPR